MKCVLDLLWHCKWLEEKHIETKVTKYKTAFVVNLFCLFKCFILVQPAFSTVEQHSRFKKKRIFHF